VKNRIVTATELKAKCLVLLDEVDDRKDMIIVTERGRAVATLQPVKRSSWKSPRGAWIGKVEIVGDIVERQHVAFVDRAPKGLARTLWVADPKRLRGIRRGFSETSSGIR
jgi:prevent-host-death family protein